MIKLNSICSTVENIANIIQNNNLVVKMKDIQLILIRDIVSTDSLYI